MTAVSLLQKCPLLFVQVTCQSRLLYTVARRNSPIFQRLRQVGIENAKDGGDGVGSWMESPAREEEPSLIFPRLSQLRWKGIKWLITAEMLVPITYIEDLTHLALLEKNSEYERLQLAWAARQIPDGRVAAQSIADEPIVSEEDRWNIDGYNRGTAEAADEPQSPGDAFEDSAVSLEEARRAMVYNADFQPELIAEKLVTRCAYFVSRAVHRVALEEVLKAVEVNLLVRLETIQVCGVVRLGCVGCAGCAYVCVWRGLEGRCSRFTRLGLIRVVIRSCRAQLE